MILFCLYGIVQKTKYVTLTPMFRCVSCSKTKFLEYRRIDGYALDLCLNCDLLQTQTKEKERQGYINEKYSHQYVEDYRQALPKLYARFTKQISFVHEYKIGGKLLDIGCGIGYFLKFIKDNNKKWRIFGVEPRSLLRKVARQNTGETIKNGTLSNIPFPDSYFDVVTCYDVLEHSKELNKNMTELKRVLKPSGLLFIQAPNYKSFMAYITRNRWDWWCIPDHVLHFSYNFLTNYLKKSGFTVLKSYTYEDQVDYLSNIKGRFSQNYFTKILYFLLLPLFLVIERIGWITNNGGLVVVIARK